MGVLGNELIISASASESPAWTPGPALLLGCRRTKTPNATGTFGACEILPRPFAQALWFVVAPLPPTETDRGHVLEPHGASFTPWLDPPHSEPQRSFIIDLRVKC